MTPEAHLEMTTWRARKEGLSVEDALRIVELTYATDLPECEVCEMAPAATEEAVPGHGMVYRCAECAPVIVREGMW